MNNSWFTDFLASRPNGVDSAVAQLRVALEALFDSDFTVGAACDFVRLPDLKDFRPADGLAHITVDFEPSLSWWLYIVYAAFRRRVVILNGTAISRSTA